MSLTERERHDAYEALQAAFGDNTDTVIRMLSADRDNLVTKDDLAVTTAVLRTEMADIRTEMADLRTEMADLRTDVKTEIAEVKTEMSHLRVQFANDINTAFAAQTRTMTIGLVASVILIALTNTLTVLVG